MPIEFLEQAPNIIPVISEDRGMLWTNIALVLITIVGWIVVNILNSRQQKENLKNNLKAKIYEDFWKLRDKLFSSSGSLSVRIHGCPPFDLMEVVKVSDKEILSAKDSLRDVEHYNNYLNELSKEKSNYHNAFLEFWMMMETWIHVTPELIYAKECLTKKFAELLDSVNEYYNYLQSLDRYKWQDWNRGEIEKKANSLWKDVFDVGCYTEDMMVLIHNELIGDLFGESKEFRKPNDADVKLLTKKGFICYGEHEKIVDNNR